MQASPTSKVRPPRAPKIPDGCVLAACTVGFAFSLLTLMNYITGLFIYPLHSAFGWSRQTVTLSSTIITSVTLITSLIVGHLSDRTPLRRLVIISQAAFGIGLILVGLLTRSSVLGFYALFVVVAVGAGGTLPITFNKIVSSSIAKRQGMAFGVVFCGSGVCGFVVPPMLSIVIEHFGWRLGFVAAGCLPLGAAFTTSLFWLPRTRLVPKTSTRQDGLTLRQALKNYRLWALALSFFLGGGITYGMVINMAPMLRDRGLSPLGASGAISAFAFSVIIGRLLAGYLIDRLWAPIVGFALMIPAALSAVYLAEGPITLATSYGAAIVLGLASGTEGDMMSYLGLRYFGGREIGRIYSVLFVFFTAGIAVISPLFGRAYDLTGSYQTPLLLAGLAWVVCASLLITLGRYPEDFIPMTEDVDRLDHRVETVQPAAG